MKKYSGLFPEWAIVPWIPLNIYFTYQFFVAAYGERNIGYALPVVFIIGLVGSVITFFILDFLLWRVLIKLREVFSVFSIEQGVTAKHQDLEASGAEDAGRDQPETSPKPLDETFRLSDEYDPDPEVRASFDQSRRYKCGRVVKMVLATLFVIWIVHFLILNRHLFL